MEIKTSVMDGRLIHHYRDRDVYTAICEVEHHFTIAKLEEKIQIFGNGCTLNPKRFEKEISRLLDRIESEG